MADNELKFKIIQKMIIKNTNYGFFESILIRELVAKVSAVRLNVISL
jgi:hypothetical protein